MQERQQKARQQEMVEIWWIAAERETKLKTFMKNSMNVTYKGQNSRH